MDPIPSRNRRLQLLSLLATAVVVVACASSAALPQAQPIAAPADGAGGIGQPVPAEPANEAPADKATGTGSNANPVSILRDNLQVVYTGSLGLVVDDMQTSLAKARTAVLALGGYVGASQESNDGDRSTAVITYRIPATRWEDGLASLRGLATKVVNEQTQAAEVGGQIVDLEARIRNLRASEEVLVGIARGTVKVSDLLEVQDRVSAVRGEIEQLEAQRAQLKDQVGYGTLVTTFGTEVVAVQEAKQGWDPASDVDGALATVISAGQAFVSGAIWFGIVWLPAILVLLVLALLVRWAVRRFLPASKPADPVAGWGGGS